MDWKYPSQKKSTLFHTFCATLRCTLEPGDSIIDCPPTFTMYAFDAAVNNANVITGKKNDYILNRTILFNF